MVINLHSRSLEKEYIDDPKVGADLLQQTYLQMKNINVETLGYWPTMDAVRHFLTRYGSNRTMRILDIGCGNGETLRQIHDYAAKRKFSVELTGIDLSKEIISSAIELTACRINFIHGDVLVYAGDETYDLIINSLTMHHLTDQEIIKLMQWMGAHTQLGWFISDLHRHPIAYYFIKYFDKLRGFNQLICHDAPLSVARGFRRHEWVNLVTRAGFDLNHTKIFWYPNFRFGVRYEKSL